MNCAVTQKNAEAFIAEARQCVQQIASNPELLNLTRSPSTRVGGSTFNDLKFKTPFDKGRFLVKVTGDFIRQLQKVAPGSVDPVTAELVVPLICWYMALKDTDGGLAWNYLRLRDGLNVHDGRGYNKGCFVLLMEEWLKDYDIPKAIVNQILDLTYWSRWRESPAPAAAIFHLVSFSYEFNPIRRYDNFVFSPLDKTRAIKALGKLGLGKFAKRLFSAEMRALSALYGGKIEVRPRQIVLKLSVNSNGAVGVDEFLEYVKGWHLNGLKPAAEKLGLGLTIEFKDGGIICQTAPRKAPTA